MEPTIYKPSIYKGAGIYKAGSAGAEFITPQNVLLNCIFTKPGNSINISGINASIDYNDTIELKVCFPNGITSGWAGWIRFISRTASPNAFNINNTLNYNYGNPYWNSVWGGNTTRIDNISSLIGSDGVLTCIANKDKIILNENEFQIEGINNEFPCVMDRIINQNTGDIGTIVFYCTVTDENGIKKYDFVPVRNINTNLCGLYEKINGTLHTYANMTGY